MHQITPDTSVFVLVSFEGPDLYSQAGGLGVRIATLADSLAQAGFVTHLFFIGDPKLPGEERRHDGRLILHRWGQWISKNCPGGVYEGEEAKRQDMEKSLPPWVREHVILPAVAEGKTANGRSQNRIIVKTNTDGTLVEDWAVAWRHDNRLLQLDKGFFDRAKTMRSFVKSLAKK